MRASSSRLLHRFCGSACYSWVRHECPLESRRPLLTGANRGHHDLKCSGASNQSKFSGRQCGSWDDLTAGWPSNVHGPSELHSSAPAADDRPSSNVGAEPSLIIDKSGLFQVRPHSHAPPQDKEPETDMAKHIKALIQVGVLLKYEKFLTLL